MGLNRGKSKAKTTLQYITDPESASTIKQLKEELRFAKDACDQALKSAVAAKAAAGSSKEETAKVLGETVSMKSHQELVDRHNEILKDYGKLRMDVMKGSPVVEIMKAQAIKEKIVEKEVIREVTRIHRVLDKKKILIFSVLSSLLGFGLGALIF